jgi:hypothetical protein
MEGSIEATQFVASSASALRVANLFLVRWMIG